MKTHECPATKVCIKCGIDKPLSEYSTTRTMPRKDGTRRKYTISKCKACVREYSNARNAANPERMRRISSESYQRTREASLKRKAVYYEANRDKYSKWRKDSFNRDPEGQKERQKQWSLDNIERVRKNWLVNENRRRSRKLQAMPKWAEHEKIDALYAECLKVSKETGIKHHVDHIYPLKNDRVCGLHCIGNLRIITATENNRKSNKFVEDIC